MKRLTSLLRYAAELLSLFALASVSGAYAQTPEKIELRYQGWNSMVLYPELAEDLGYLAPVKLRWIGNTISGPQDVQATVTGDVDFGGAFNGAIVKLAAAHAPVKAVVAYMGADKLTNGVLFVGKDGPVHGPRDLIGRKIGVNTLGGYYEYLINTYLEKSGLSADEIKKVTLVVGPPVNGAQLLKQKQIDAVFLQDILKDRLLKEGWTATLMNDHELLGDFALASYILTDKFIAQNPVTSRKFVEATARAIAWAQTTPREQVVARLQKIINARNRAEDKTAVQFWKSSSLGARGGVIAEKDFTTYIDWYVKNGVLKPGQVKAEAIYTNRFNPFIQ